MTTRPATRADFPAIVGLFASVEEAVLGRPSRLDADMVDAWLHTISFETNTWLVEEDGAIVAGAFGELHGSRGNAAGAVLPQAQGRGLGTRLAGLVEERLAAEGAERVQTWTLAGDDAADELFVSRGYREVRRFWEMAKELDADPPAPTVVAAPFREDDARAFHAALEEAFAEGWAHNPESFEHWWTRQQSRENYDPSLWFLVRDGGEIAAAVRNEAHGQEVGYVGMLGVRRRWRGRGFGRSLLLHSFREFRRRGIQRAMLGVDAANPTGATQLYESVGMHVELENVVWEKMLVR